MTCPTPGRACSGCVGCSAGSPPAAGIARAARWTAGSASSLDHGFVGAAQLLRRSGRVNARDCRRPRRQRAGARSTWLAADSRGFRHSQIWLYFAVAGSRSSLHPIEATRLATRAAPPARFARLCQRLDPPIRPKRTSAAAARLVSYRIVAGVWQVAPCSASSMRGFEEFNWPGRSGPQRSATGRERPDPHVPASRDARRDAPT